MTVAFHQLVLKDSNRRQVAYAFSGSMLGTELRKVRSYPVGFVTELVMHPMDFEEFCWAVGVSREGLETVRTSCHALQPVPRSLDRI